jgi:hypothetical protein
MRVATPIVLNRKKPPGAVFAGAVFASSKVVTIQHSAEQRCKPHQVCPAVTIICAASCCSRRREGRTRKSRESGITAHTAKVKRVIHKTMQEGSPTQQPVGASGFSPHRD